MKPELSDSRSCEQGPRPVPRDKVFQQDHTPCRCCCSSRKLQGSTHCPAIMVDPKQLFVLEESSGPPLLRAHQAWHRGQLAQVLRPASGEIRTRPLALGPMCPTPTAEHKVGAAMVMTTLRFRENESSDCTGRDRAAAFTLRARDEEQSWSGVQSRSGDKGVRPEVEKLLPAPPPTWSPLLEAMPRTHLDPFLGGQSRPQECPTPLACF